MIYADSSPNYSICPDCGGDAMNYGGTDFTCECGFYFVVEEPEEQKHGS